MYRTESADQQQIDLYASDKLSRTKAAKRISVILALLALYVLWGSTYLAMRITLESVPAFMMAGIRYIVAGAILYSCLRLRHVPAPTYSQWLGSALVGTLLLV